METLDTLTKRIDESLDRTNKEFQRYLDKLVDKRDTSIIKLRNLRSILPRLIDGLAKEHLVISDIGYYVANTSNATLICTITAKSDGKFKFLKDQGYDSRGAGKNQKALNAKAEKINSNILKLAQININVNSMSLEKRKNGIENSVHIEFYL